MSNILKPEAEMKLAEEKAGKELDAFINKLSDELNVFVVPRVQLVADVLSGVKVAGGVIQVVHKKRVGK